MIKKAVVKAAPIKAAVAPQRKFGVAAPTVKRAVV